MRAAWETAYADEPFVQLLPDGRFPTQWRHPRRQHRAHRRWPSTKPPGGSSRSSAIDNLTKGTAGAAIQCLNIALGFDETLGLSVNGVAP